MAKYSYSYKTDLEKVGRAVLKDTDISTKSAVEICSSIRNKTVEEAKKYLEAVKNKKKAVRFTRFTEGAGHKKGIGSGKYPIKAAENVLNAINSAESNAIDKGLSRNLKIIHVSAQKASTPWHYGRHRRRKMKRTHIEVLVKEAEEKKQQKDPEVKQTEESKEESAPKKEEKETKK
ncbi:MAG: 50S ribosomal protein L22 [DPANN group archaeon]|nr:50S ribosomal protein L22 [DPANN group archaeon]